MGSIGKVSALNGMGSRRFRAHTPRFVAGGLLLLLCALLGQAQTSAAPKLLLPAALAYDAAGNLYIADKQRHQVFEATLGGTLVAVAGTGVQGFAGDGGPPTQAELNEPQGLAFGPDGTLYIADTGNARIRIVSGGLISTFAGTGTAGGGGDGDAADEATLRSPTALAVDGSGALLVCDTADQRIRRVQRGVILPFAGNGVQGYAGDGAPAVAAELDEPSGLAVLPDGRVVVADTHNRRVRVVGADGTMQTFAGTGTQGPMGDGGPALQASFAGPRGLAVLPDGSLLVADGDAQRVRRISVTGFVTTIIGSGSEGMADEGSTASQSALRLPRALAISAFGQAVVADSLNGAVRVLTNAGQVYQPAALIAGRSTLVQGAWSSTQTYGQALAAVTVSGAAGTPQGSVTIQEGESPLGVTQLANGSGTVMLPTLTAGAHTLTVRYAGDGLNPASVAVTDTMQINPLPVTASAGAAMMRFGAAEPAITGSLTGVLPQDQGQVGVTFGLAPGVPAAVGQYTVLPTLTGPRSANYTVSMAANSGQLQVVPASTTTLLGLVPQGYPGVPVPVAATVVPDTGGRPSGTVQFLAGSTVVASGTVVNGSAAGVYTPAAVGSQPVTAVYSGDGNYQASVSAAQPAVTRAMPDFTITAAIATTSANAGGSATYSLTVASAPGPFTGVVVLSATGQPAGSSVAFTPTQVVPGTGSAVVTATVQTAQPQARLLRPGDAGRGVLLACGGGFLLLGWWPGQLRRKRMLAGLLGSTLTLCGCGARTVGEGVHGTTTQTWTLQITGTSTNLAGAVVSHSTPVVLTIQQSP